MMTLPRRAHLDAAQRCVDVLNASGEAATTAAFASAVRSVLTAWGEEVDSSFDSTLRAFRRACGELRALFLLTDRDDAARAVDRYLARYTARPRLVHEPPLGWHLHVDPDDARWDTWFAANSAVALAMLLVESPGVPWGVCAATDCDCVFVDHGRRGPQRYCSPTCATRDRVRRHRARASERRGAARAGRVESVDVAVHQLAGIPGLEAVAPGSCASAQRSARRHDT